MAAFALIGPAIKMLASQGVKKAAMGAAKGIAKDKAKSFVTGKGRKKKKTKSGGRGGALTTTGDEEGSEGGGGAIVPTTPMVGGYKVETLPDKPDEVGKPSKVSYESINNQLDSIIGLTNALKKTSTVKLKNAENRRKAERKADEKAKKRQKENMLEGAGGAALGLAGNLYGKATKGFDPLNFFTQIFLGSLFNWITTHGSKIIALLKGALALFNNAGKIFKAGIRFLGKAIKGTFGLLSKVASPITKLGKGVGNALKGVGKRIGGAFGKLGNSIKNFAKGILNKLKAAGKFLTSPIRALQGLTGSERKAVQSSKSLSNLAKTAGGGTASRAAGGMSNAARSVRLKHGDEAARMYQGMVDNGMKPSRAAKSVNKAISAGKLTSEPLKGLARQGGGSQLMKGGIKRTAKRGIIKMVGKGGLKLLKRIPIVGGLISLVVSLLSGDPVTQALFKAGGAVLGGFLGSFIPIPVVGTLIGEILGEYVGDLLYVLTKGEGGGAQAVGNKIKEDIGGLFSAGKAAMDWVGDGFKRMYEGVPKLEIPGYLQWLTFGVKEIPNPIWMANPFNIFEKTGIVGKAFFSRDPMVKGQVKENDSNDTPTPVSAETQQTLNTALPSSVDTNMSIGSQLKKNFGYKTGQEVKFQYGGAEYVARKTNQGWQFFDQKGMFGNYRMVDTKGKNQQMVAAFIKSVDKTSGTTGTPTSTVQPQSSLMGTSISAPQDARGSRFSSDVGATGSVPNDPEFMKEVNRVSQKFGIDPTDLLGKLASESGFDPAADNGTHVGLIQFSKDSAAAVGTSQSALKGMSRAEQMKYVEKYFDYWKLPYGASAGHLYTVTFLPAFASKPGSYVLAKRDGFTDEMGNHPASWYTHNAGLDMNNDGSITIDELGERIQQKKREFGITGGSTNTTSTPDNSDKVTNQDQSGSVQPRTATLDNSGKVASQDQSDSDISSTPAPAQVSPSTSSQTQMSNGINGISQQLSYEESGNTVVMVQGSGGQQTPMSSGGGKGTPVMMGSGDVVNSYYKSQLMGFLYKQG